MSITARRIGMALLTVGSLSIAPMSLAAAAANASMPMTGLKCAAHVSSASPAKYSDVTVYVATRAKAHVATVAHYKTTNHAKSATANATGHAAITYYISDATKGYRVVVSVTTSYKGVSGHCSTSFTPR